MSIRAQTMVAAAAAALATAYFGGTLAFHVTEFMYGDRATLCGGSDGSKWEWGSMDSDCYRAGFLWPAVVLLASTLVSAAFTLCLALRPLQAAGAGEGFATDGSAPLARLGVGNMKTPQRRPKGTSVLIDNRMRVGAWVVVLLGVQTTLFGAWWVVAHNDADSAPEMRHLPRLLAQTTGLLLVAAVACVRTLSLNRRRVYAGLFPWVLPVLVCVLVGVCAGEAYGSFFTPRNAAVPIVGSRASARSNLLVASVFVGAALVLLFACAQWRPIYMRPREGAAEASLHLVENNDSEDGDDDESTPISAPGDTKECDLLDSPESNASWFSRMTFGWLGESMRLGATRRMEYTDMYRLAPEDCPVSCWRRYLQYRKPGRPLLMVMAMTLAPELVLQFCLSVLLCAMQFSGPFFLQRILRTIQNLKHHHDTGKPIPGGVARSAYLDAAGLLVFSLLTLLLSSQVEWVGRHIGMRIKGFIVAEMSSKTLRRRGKGSFARAAKDAAAGKEKKEEGEEKEEEPQLSADGKIMNLLTADFQRVVEVSACLERVYAFPLTLVLGMWYMYRLMGVSALFGVSVAGLYVPLTRVMYKYLTKLELSASALNDDRVSAVSEVVHGIKAVKLFGWESRFSDSVDQKRERQLAMQWRVYRAMTLIHAVALTGPMLILIIMLAVYSMVLGNSLTAEVAFTTISVFQIVRVVLERLPGFFMWATNATVSVARIDSYLHQPQVQALESRVAPAGADDALGFDCASLEWDVALPAKDVESVPNSTPATVVDSGEQTPLLGTTSTSHRSPSGISLGSNTPEDMVCFSLKDINVRFPLGGLSIVAGPTGSGKSSLLSALVGEMTLTKGRILLPTANAQEIAAHDHKYSAIIALSGEGLVVRDIAYVAQESWLRNATIRENILFGEHYDRERYEEVLRVCALKPDLRILPAGDLTEIGERGVTLSGGQKQRVSLARAVYSSRRILLIDDCLSAVDAHTGKHILLKCLLNKSRLMSGRTCLLVTHHLSMCLPFAQYLLIMHQGRVALHGSPESLEARGTLMRMISELETAKRSLRDADDADGEYDDEDDNEGRSSVSSRRSRGGRSYTSTRSDSRGKEVDALAHYSLAEFAHKNASTEKNLQKHINDRRSEDEYNAERLRVIAEQRGLDSTRDLSALQGTLIDEEEREEGHVKFEVWQTYLSACGSDSFWLTSFAMLILCQAVVVMQDYWIRIWVASTSGGSGAATNLISDTGPGYWLLVYVVIGLLSISIRLGLKYYTFSGAICASRKIHRQLMGAVIHATPRFFDSTPFGRIINRFGREMLSTDEQTMEKLLGWALDIVVVVSVFTIIMAVKPAFFFVAVVVVATYASIGYYYLNASRELKRLESNSMSPILSLFSELLLGVSTIRAFNINHYYLKEAINQINAQNRPFYMVWSALRWLTVRIDVASATVSFTCALFILSSLDWIDPGLAGFALMYSLSFSERMMYVIRNFSDNELNMNAIERILQYMDVEQEAPLHSSTRHRPPVSWPESGFLHIKNLVIEYVPGVPVLHNITLSVSHGEKIGVVGRTGAGKSSLALALLRFIEATKGRIVLDGVDISKIGLEDLRRNVTIIPQDPVLFNGTIRYNLDPFGEYPDEILWEALQRTFLVAEHASGSSSSSSSSNNNNTQAAAAANSIASQSVEGTNDEAPMLERMTGIFNTLEAEIKENGQNLSLGQRQLVALARALVRRSKLVVMDEATASVDFDTDDRIQRTIRGHEFANSTLFCVAHRLRTIIDYDRVLVLDRGNIAQFDTPYNLLQNKGGIFWNMCENSGELDHLYAVASRKQTAVGGSGSSRISRASTPGLLSPSAV
ncbi:hypothetical protein IW140_003278 [Coemansia sp. RSA 1813]|nr:hypothetical protein EV178_002897 [Coemansia sp. RSA 1646]KAJ1771687.1 hypothetical protein LPJ74_002114 [Coemansia sp. RSA 1843]KAJ2089676.1 hypothetical protein IW138_003274 [Coemansia sp. RSA 986]KAJ2214128.1 hypothetical protein EV179_003267 [Coemansia sp. RSA 487]KAJ2569186.1 hypothetical protein IW140_003278 [Coemansia sp. RSA 1813]